MTANGEVQTREEATICQRIGLIRESDASRRTTRSFFDSENSARIMGIFTTGPAGQKPHLTSNGKRIDCNISNYVPFVVPGLSTSSSTIPTPASSTSSSQDSVFAVSRYTENPVLERSGSMSEESKTQIKMKDAKKYKAIYCLTCRTGYRNSESFTLTIPWKFGKACEDLSWNHCTSTPHRSETNGIAERAVRRVKGRHLCRIVAIRSG